MLRLVIFITILVLVQINNANKIENVLYKIEKSLNFFEIYFEQINFDGLFGLILGQAQLEIIQKSHPSLPIINYLINRCKIIKQKILPLISNSPKYMQTFKFILLNSHRWSAILPPKFCKNCLNPNMGIYTNWTPETILSNRKAEFNGTKSDKCLEEILINSSANKNCAVSEKCAEMMLANRIDSGYLLTHRLLYQLVARLRNCKIIEIPSTVFCNLMLKEARTNRNFGFVYQDIFLEQVVFCGMLGYSEFLNDNFSKNIQTWQNNFGCFHSFPSNELTKRTSNQIIFGCSDHSTGLGLAALILNLKKLLLLTSI